MKFEWDERKRQSNLKKHHIDFEDAEIVFSGPVVTIPDELRDYGEERWFTLGLLGDVVVAISHTERANRIRIISMRKAERYEAKIFFEKIARSADTEDGLEEIESDDGR